MKIHWEERMSNLSDQCARLKEENRNLEARRGQLEQENTRLNSEIADQIRKISVVEANYQNLEHVSREGERQRERVRQKGNREIECRERETQSKRTFYLLKAE